MTASDRINLRYLLSVLIGKLVIYGGAFWIAVHNGIVRFP